MITYSITSPPAITSGNERINCSSGWHFSAGACNPAPITKYVAKLPLGDLAALIVNETEAGGLVSAGDPETLCYRLAERFPTTLCVLTAGERGAWAIRGCENWHNPGLSRFRRSIPQRRVTRLSASFSPNC